MSIKSNTESLRSLLDAVNALPEAGSSEPVLQDKTITPTATAQTVTADDGYDGLSSVIVNAMPTATQATPSISVNSSGLITASSTQTAGYVSAGTKSATKQLTTQAAQTITPGTSNKTIASGRYLTGTQTIEGDANLVPENIKSGVSIFGINGSLDIGGGSGGDIGAVRYQVNVNIKNIAVYGVDADGQDVAVGMTPRWGYSGYFAENAMICLLNVAGNINIDGNASNIAGVQSNSIVFIHISGNCTITTT